MIKKENGVNFFYKIIICLMFFNSAFALERKVFLERLENINKGEIGLLISDMSKLSREVDEYVNINSEKCHSAIISEEVNESGEKIIKKNVPSRKQVKACLKNLIQFKMDFIKKAYVGRKLYLDYQHKKQREEFGQLQEEELTNLEKLLKSYN